MTNLETNLVTRTMTTGTGNYAIAFLPPGTYRLEVRHAGFKAFRQDRIVLKIQERPTVDVKLEPGDVATSITVDAAVSQLETSTASRGEVITERKIVDMPLNGRSVFMLGLLTPGTTFTKCVRKVQVLFYEMDPNRLLAGMSPILSPNLILAVTLSEKNWGDFWQRGGRIGTPVLMGRDFGESNPNPGS